MAAFLHAPSAGWPRLGALATCALALALFLGVFALRVSDPNVGDAVGAFFVVPVGVLALRFGLRGGLAGALLGVALVVAWDRPDPPALSVLGFRGRGVALLMLGVLLGVFIDRRRGLEAELLRYYNASLDLLATADLSGRFMRVNPAWERTLGHSAKTMCSRPFVEFVHPEDREATIGDTVAIANGSLESVGFRNRFCAADGSYRCPEWNASVSPSEGVVNAVARDVTVQRKAEEQLADSAKRLQEKVEQRTHELDAARAETLRLLAVVAEYRDDDTSQHTERVGMIAAEIAVRLGLPAAQVRRIREAALLHDVGKIATPDSILLKPGGLSAQEQEVMQRHAALGARLLSSSSSPVLQTAAVIAATHHEWWDGTGYPRRLAGERIPLVGRVVAVADVFDALTHDRPYKPAWPVGQAIARIQHAAGSQFDPRVVAAFLKLHMTPWLWARATALKTRCTQSAPRGSVGAPPPPGQRHVPPATPDALVDAAWREVHKRWRPNTYESLCKVPSQ